MTGSVHMYMGGTSETSLFQPEFAVMDAPYLFRDYAHLMKAAKSDAVKEMGAKLEKNRGVKLLTAEIYYGARHLTTRNKPIKTPADLKGMLVRAPDQPIYLEAVRAMGATPTPVAFSDLYMALKQGVVDGQENPIPTIYTYKYYEAQKYLMLTGHMLRVNVVGADAGWYNKLAPELKEIITKALDEAVKLNNELTLKQEKDMLDELKKLGMEVVQPDVEAFREAAKVVPAKFEDRWGKGTFDRLKAVK
jgi:tripartite ATP-independent transporter DctP family solute receptor